MKKINFAKKLGIIGSFICIIYQVLPFDLVFSLLINSIGIIFVILAIYYLSIEYKDPGIFKKALGFGIMNISAKGIILKMSVGLIEKYKNFLKFKGSTFHLSKEFVTIFLLTYLVLVISSYLWQSIFFKLSKYTNQNCFKIGGFFYFLGIALLIIPLLMFTFLSKFLILGSWILILIGFYKLQNSSIHI